MYIDFYINDIEINELKSKEIVKEILSYGCVSSITVPSYLVKSVKPLLPSHIELSCFIDYPIGISDSKTRLYSIEQAKKLGISTIDISMPQYLAANRKYNKIREDIQNVIDTCFSDNIKIRYILEYRIFDHRCLKKICEIFDSFGIQYVFPSTGYFIDNLADNIIASNFLHQNSKNINIISTGNIWLNKHFEILKKSKIFGFRTNSLHSLKNFVSFDTASKL
jgi:deoxyribose-phosphate aldolase